MNPRYCDFCDKLQPAPMVVIEPSDGPAICEACVETCWRSIRIAQAQIEGLEYVPYPGMH